MGFLPVGTSAAAQARCQESDKQEAGRRHVAAQREELVFCLIKQSHPQTPRCRGIGGAASLRGLEAAAKPEGGGLAGLEGLEGLEKAAQRVEVEL